MWCDVNDIPHCVVTNAPRPTAERQLKALGLGERFKDKLIVGMECEQAKPEPHPYVED